MADAALTPEGRLVFRVADLARDRAEILDLAAAVRAWPRVLSLAEREVAIAPLWRALQESGAPVPAEVADYLGKSALVSDFRMRYLASRAERTIAALAASRVPVMLLKGAALGAMRDPSFRDRPMTDLDLLVHRRDAARARGVVIADGWPETTDPVLLELLQDHNHLPPFVDPRMPGLRLELHVTLLPSDHSFAFDETDLWRDGREAPAPFTGARIPSREHLLLHAAIHFAWQHTMAFGAWRTFRLVSGVLADGPIDWDRFVGVARDARAASVCHWTFRLAARMSGLAIPAPVIASLAPPNPEPFARALERHFIARLVPGEGIASPSELLADAFWRAALRPVWSGHRAAGRLDPERRWDRARGRLPTETAMARYARHLADHRTWWAFLVRTVLGRSPAGTG